MKNIISTLQNSIPDLIENRIGIKNWTNINLLSLIFFLAEFHLAISPQITFFSQLLFCSISFFNLLVFGFSGWKKIFAPWLIILNVVTQISLVSWNFLREYQSLNFNYYDSGWFANPVFNFINGFGFVNSEIGLSEFADHFSPNLLLLSPLFSLYPNPAILIIIKIIAYILSFYLIYRICLLHNFDKNLTYFIILLFSINIGVINYMGFEFQTSNLTIPFIFIVFILLEKNKILPAYLLGIFICGFKETSGFALVSIGLLDFFYNKKTRGISYSIFFFILTLIIFKMLMPLLSGTNLNVNDSIFDPFCCKQEKTGFIIYILSTLGFIFLFSPKAILVLIPSLASSLLGNRPGSHSLTFHYQDMAMAISFCLLVKILSVNKDWISTEISKIKELKIFSFVLLLLIFFVNNRSFYEFVKTHNPNEKTLMAIDQINKFKNDYHSIYKKNGKRIWAQTSLAFYLSDEYQIKSIMNTNETIMDANPNYVVLCDYSETKWPIENDYEQLKILMRSDVEKGVRVEHLGYYPLIIFERK